MRAFRAAADRHDTGPRGPRAARCGSCICWRLPRLRAASNARFAAFFSKVNAPVTRYPNKGRRKEGATHQATTEMFEGCLPRGRLSVRKQRCKCEVSKGDGRGVISTPAV